MAVNLATKYETKLDERFAQRSLTEAWTGKNYSWEGVNAIKIWSMFAPDLNDYDATASANRFGTPSEVDDEVTTYALRRKRSFSKVIDVTNSGDSMFVKKANAYLKQAWDESYVPEIDKYRLSEWANGAGLGTVGAALTKSNILEAVLTGAAALDDANVPTENRVVFLRSDVAVKCKLAPELGFSQNWLDKTVIAGKIAEVNGMSVVSVPTSRMPAGAEFLIKYKNATADPVKLRMLRAHDDPQGYAGVLMEGLVRYDAFVLAQKADGLYVYANTGSVAATPTFSISSNSVTITATGGTIKYTTDGTNPKTSDTAKVYSSAVAITKNTKFRAYASQIGKLDSPIAAYDAVYT